MIHRMISSEGDDSQSLPGSGALRDHAPEESEFGSEETLLNLLKVMSRDIRGSLLSMLATLKLLNRGYYGNMDDEAANQTKDLLSSTTRLIGMVDACLGRPSAADDGAEIAAPQDKSSNSPAESFRTSNLRRRGMDSAARVAKINIQILK